MNWADPVAVASYIGVGGTGLLALILRMRKVWVRDNRDVTYDTEQTKWVEGLQSEIKQLRIDKEEGFKRELQYVTKLAQTEALNQFLTKEVENMRRTMAAMEASMSAMKARLRSIDSTIQTSDLTPLTKD